MIYKNDISDYAIATMPADGLAPICAKPSVGIVVTMFGFSMYKR